MLCFDVPLDDLEFVWSHRPHEVASGPSQGTWHALIRSPGRATLAAADELAQQRRWPEADKKMHMILQHCLSKHLHRTGAARIRHRCPHILNGEPIDARHPSPGVPGDVGVQLVGSMVGQGCCRPPLANPGLKPGVSGPGLAAGVSGPGLEAGVSGPGLAARG